MLYQALYRKYRPKTFNDVAGQEVIVKTLKNIIKNNKLTHAYLFIGPRGTGKTSIAKIFAKTINCENSKDGISCENCDICISNNNNENIDVIEMDAASNNGVDEIREIKNHVTLLPTMSKYKVYIIDEVHMLTTGAFNALLKTLEEPPKHVIFILATTEPHKIPLTIISRCQSFEFKPIPKSVMTQKLKYICDEEKINVTDDALDLIAIDSNGGMRDAIGLLDQLNAYTNGDIKKDDVVLLSGRMSDKEIYNLFEQICNDNIKECFDEIEKFDGMGKNFVYICEDIIKYLRDSYLKLQIGETTDIMKILPDDKIIDIIMMFNSAISDMKNAKDKKIFFDLTIIKILNILNKQTNVRNKKTESMEVSKPKIEENTNVTKDKTSMNKEVNDTNLEIYSELMNIRLNNILSKADKMSLSNYSNTIKNLENDITNLDHLKVINILSDCNLKAGSTDGMVLTTDNNNMLKELYENLFDIEDTISSVLNKKIKICFLNNDYWLKERVKYIEKIKNKEEIEELDENAVLNKISSKSKQKEENEFEDLIEIGEI